MIKLTVILFVAEVRTKGFGHVAVRGARSGGAVGAVPRPPGPLYYDPPVQSDQTGGYAQHCCQQTV